ncbi:MFS transporter [[Curtobacterium] plantarum]|uniref:MFS transporter n=1 Tax=[Curtobacterium] plantarum TaxID=221276 RepID=UPI001ABFE564|nr:MFS transporter [[Curtobacterium] plantarum]
MVSRTDVFQKTDGAGLLSYITAATLARIADGGAVLGVILLCVADSRFAQHAGTLAACVTLPHLVGPFVARKIDTADDGRKVIAFACLLYAGLFIMAVATFSHVSLVLTAAFLITAGLCGPLLTGGISSRLSSIAGSDQRSQRSAQGWDVATYGLGGTLGPSLVASFAAWYSPQLALYLLAAGAMLAAVFIMRLPRQPPAHGGDVSRVPGAVRTFHLIA